MALQPSQKVILILLIVCAAVGYILIAHDIQMGTADWRVLIGLGALFIINVFYARRRLKAKSSSGDAVENTPPPKSN
jgi:hypothetical protein